MIDDLFISVDWGTSSFRIKLVRMPEIQIIDEITSPHGVKMINDQWNDVDGSRQDFFLDFLNDQIDQLNVHFDGSLNVVISGMASSSIGLHELPYAKSPFRFDGSSLIVEQLISHTFPHSVHLISGVSTEKDVMRGEETQIVGLTSFADKNDETLFILPGTHSKHVICQNDQVKDFNTFMTGELFQTISEQTVLKESIARGILGEREWMAFEEGVSASLDNTSMSGELFKIRVAYLKGQQTKVENYYFLSGLLIAEELKGIKEMNVDSIKVCASGDISQFYMSALQKYGLGPLTDLIPEKDVELAVVKGQWEIINNKLK